MVSGRLVRLTAEGDEPRKQGGEAERESFARRLVPAVEQPLIGDLSFGPEGALYVSGGEGAIYTDTDYGQYENLCGDPPGANAKEPR